MSALSIQPTYPIFTDQAGEPLEAGYIWIGTANLNPITNPISIYWDAALTQPAVQPIRTVSGYPSNAGTPGRLYVNSDYSIQVQNKNATVVYSAPAATERYNDVVIDINAEDVTYDPPLTGAVQTNVEAKLAQIISVKDFGAVGDGVTDDTAAIQKAFDFAGANGQGHIIFPTADYKISGTILFPTNVYVDFYKSSLTGPNSGSNAMFESGYWDGSQMVTNIGTPTATHVLLNVVFVNGIINNSPLAFNLFNCLFGCKFQNINFSACDFCVFSDECFFSIFDNLFANASMTATAVAAYHFGFFSNAQTITNCYSTGRELGFQFDGSGSAVRVIGCTAENGLNGIKITGQIQAILIQSCYFEALSQNAIDLNYTEVHQNIEIANNYFADVDTCVKGNVQNPGDTNYVPTFIRASNKFANTATFWYVTTDNVFTTGKVELANEILLVSNTAADKRPTLPSFYVVGGKQSIDAEYSTFDNSSGLVTTKCQFYANTVIPFNYAGSAGTVLSGEVAFSNVTVTGTSPALDIVITTGITYNSQTTIVVYNLNFFDGTSSSIRLYGHIFGDQVVPADSSGKTLVASNVGGNLVLTASAFSGNPLICGANGVVRHV